jgi:hypothetical protein
MVIAGPGQLALSCLRLPHQSLQLRNVVECNGKKLWKARMLQNQRCMQDFGVLTVSLRVFPYLLQLALSYYIIRAIPFALTVRVRRYL